MRDPKQREEGILTAVKREQIYCPLILHDGGVTRSSNSQFDSVITKANSGESSYTGTKPVLLFEWQVIVIIERADAAVSMQHQ